MVLQQGIRVRTQRCFGGKGCGQILFKLLSRNLWMASCFFFKTLKIYLQIMQLPIMSRQIMILRITMTMLQEVSVIIFWAGSEPQNEVADLSKTKEPI